MKETLRPRGKCPSCRRRRWRSSSSRRNGRSTIQATSSSTISPSSLLLQRRLGGRRVLNRFAMSTIYGVAELCATLQLPIRMSCSSDVCCRGPGMRCWYNEGCTPCVLSEDDGGEGDVMVVVPVHGHASLVNALTSHTVLIRSIHHPL